MKLSRAFVPVLVALALLSGRCLWAQQALPACAGSGQSGTGLVVAPALGRVVAEAAGLAGPSPRGRALGSPEHGSLRDAVELPPPGPDEGYARPGMGIDGYFGIGEMVTLVRSSLDEYHRQGHPVLNVVGISSKHGGPQHDHGSHQNGLDADIRYPLPEGQNFSTETARETFRLLSIFVRNARTSGTPVTTFYVSPGIRQTMCRTLGAMRAGLSDGERAEDEEVAELLHEHPRHAGHFHVRIACPARLSQVCFDVGGGGPHGCP